MAKRAVLGYFKVVREFIQDSNCVKVRPFLTTIIKNYGLTAPTIGKMLVRYLCMENSVDGALTLIKKLNRNNFKVNFPVDVIWMLTEQGRSLDAFKLVFGAENNVPTMDVVDYSIIIDGLCKEGYVANAIELSNVARKRGVTLNVVTYNSLFNGLCRQSCLVEAFRLFDSLERNNISPSDITYGTLIDALVREGFLVDAKQLFDRMILKDIVPNTHIYNSLIDGYCKFGKLEEALRLIHDMESRSLKPDKFTVSAIIYGFSLEGDIEGALQFFSDMKNNGFSPDFLGFLYLVRGLSSKGRMEEARSILREMLQDASVVELINRVDAEIENESIESFLVHLCEQGNIQGAFLVLNEIGSIFFPSKRNSPSSMYKQSLSSEEDLHTFPFKNLISFHHMKFDVLYSQVASLCSDGDFEGANALAKGMISSIVRNQKHQNNI